MSMAGNNNPMGGQLNSALGNQMNNQQMANQMGNQIGNQMNNANMPMNVPNLNAMQQLQMEVIYHKMCIACEWENRLVRLSCVLLRSHIYSAPISLFT